MNKEQKTEAYITAHRLIDVAKKWAEHSEKIRNGEMIAVTDILADGTISRGYQPPNPQLYAKILKDQMANLGGETKDYVYGEVARVLKNANEEMSNFGNFKESSSLKRIIDGCNAINNFRSSIEKEEKEIPH